MSHKHRLTNLESKIQPHREETWLSIVYPITASEAEQERLRCEAIKNYEEMYGHELNRDQVNWIHMRICYTREQAKEYGVEGKYPSVTYASGQIMAKPKIRNSARLRRKPG